MTTTLEQLEAKSGRPYQHSTHDFKMAREKAARTPGNLTDTDLAVLRFFGGERCAAEATAAREQALHPAADRPVAAAATPAPRVAFPSELWDSQAADQATELERWSIAHALTAVPVAIWHGFVKAARTKREAVEGRVAALEKRIAELESRDLLHEAGDWTHGKFYAAGAAVRAHGSIWTCRESHYSTGDDLDHTKFKLWIKRMNVR